MLPFSKNPLKIITWDKILQLCVQKPKFCAISDKFCTYCHILAPFLNNILNKLN